MCLTVIHSAQTTCFLLPVILALWFFVFPDFARAQLPPGWVNASADPVSPKQADAYFQGQAVALRPQGEAPDISARGPIAALSSTTVTPEIAELARGLEYDPKLIFDYVHNHIDYVPTFGSTKGATLTYYDQSGNDFDQASLLVALLRASGYAARFQYGTMTFPSSGDPLANWIGSPAITNILGAGGIPCEVAAGNVNVARIWVQANIDGVNYVFDPAFKSYASYPPTDLATAIGYSRSQLLAAAGGTVTTDSVQNLNESAIAAKLVSYSSNLVEFFRKNAPNAGLDKMLGRRQIAETHLDSYRTSLEWPTTVTATWEEIPIEYTATLRIQHAGIDITLNIPDIAGKRLTVTYAGGSWIPELRLDGQLIASGSPTSYGGKYNLVLSVNHPYAAFGGAFGDETSTYVYKSGSTYAIISDFGGTSDRLIQKRQRESERARAEGQLDSSEAVLGETLNIIGITWMRQGNLAVGLAADLRGGFTITHHRFGRMSQEEAYYIDVGTQFESTLFRTTGSTDNDLFCASGTLHSSFEHGVLEQLMGYSIPALSTVKIIQLANANSNRVFGISSTNWSAIRPQLQNYESRTMSQFDSIVARGGFAVVPDNGRIVLGQWAGGGYMFTAPSTSMVGATTRGHIISGQVSGGYGSLPAVVQLPVVALNTLFNLGCEFLGGLWNLAKGVIDDVASGISRLFSRDPVDMATGSFVHEHSDLAVGGGPAGLTFSRCYNSAAPLDQRGLGFRWTHNYDMGIKQISDSEAVLGGRQPLGACSTIAAGYVMTDLFGDERDIKRSVVATLIAKWATDQMLTNAVSVSVGNQVLEFVRLADGRYVPPPGFTSQLLRKGDGTYEVVQRFGERTAFNASNRVASITDVDGNVTAFVYAGDRLVSVSNSFGHNLHFEYAGDLIRAVVDSAGRRVSYAYDAASNLVEYVDAEGFVWRYGYDSGHRLTSLMNPLGTVTASNTYDSLGRVSMQSTPRQGGTNALYKFLFSGFRNIEFDPLTNRTVYFFDSFERPVFVENTLGYRSTSKYDDENHVVESVDPRGNRTTRTYDRQQNLLWMTNPKKQSTRYLYDPQFRLTDVLSPAFRRVTMTYDAEHHVISTTDSLGHQTTANHYPNGQVRTKIDARGTAIGFTYDMAGNLSAAAVTNHPAAHYAYDDAGLLTSLTDQVGATTQFAYDRRGLLTNRTDALGNSTVFRYDAAGRLQSVTDRNGDTLTYSYTPSDKIQQITLPDASSISFTYDVRDNLVRMQDSLGASEYAYDVASRLTSVTDAHGFTVRNAYDEAGNVIRLTYPNGGVVTYSYDELNRLTTVSNWLGQTATYTYDQAGRLSACTNFNRTTARYEYDKADRLVCLENRRSNGSLIAAYRFELDANGNQTNIVETQPLAPVIVSRTKNYTYNAARNRLLAEGEMMFGYDAEGQSTNATAATYAFDALHRLVGIGGTNQTQFAYDGRGMRLRAIRNGTVTRYIYDAGGNLLAEADGANVITRYFVYAAGLMQMIAATGSAYTYHYNALGSTVAITDPEQELASAYSYDTFGAVVAQTGILGQPFRFVGRFGVMDEPGGLQYMRARYYDPDVGRFVSEDPAGFGGGQLNLYVYCANNPLSYVDPSGLSLLELASNPIGMLMAMISGSVGGPVGMVKASAGENAIYSGLQAVYNHPGDFVRGVFVGGAVGGLSAASAADLQVNLDEGTTTLRLEMLDRLSVLDPEPVSAGMLGAYVSFQRGLLVGAAERPSDGARYSARPATPRAQYGGGGK